MDLQRDALIKAGVEPQNIYEDKGSGADPDRVGLRRALNRCGDGDTLVIWRLDRVARSLKDLIRVGEKLKEEGIGLRSLTESLDTTTAAGMFLFHILGVVAEFERQLGRERTTAGVRLHQAKGGKHGRPPVDPAKIKLAAQLMTTGGLTMKEAAAKVKVPVSTLGPYFPGGRAQLLAEFEDQKERAKARKKGKRR